MLANITNALANVGAKQVNLAPPIFNEALATAAASVTSLGIDQMLGNDISAETLAANTLGTFIGNQLAAQAKQHYANFQAQRAIKALYHQTTIPEIQEELTLSEQNFLRQLKLHPNPIGHITESRAHSASSQKTIKQHPETQPEAKHKTSNQSVHQLPPQPHREVEVIKQEEQLEQIAINAEMQTARFKIYTTRYPFWSPLKPTNAPQPVSILNETQAAYSSGMIYQSEILTGYPYINPGLLRPSTRDIIYKNSNTMRLGFFGSKPKTTEGKYNINYKAIFHPKVPSHPTRAERNSHYFYTPCSPNAADVSMQVQIESIDALITEAKKANFSVRDTAHMLAIVRHESGFNPYAATPSSSAGGLGQFIDDTWRGSNYSESQRWDMAAQVSAMIEQFKYIKRIAHNKGKPEIYFYKYHHDGPKEDHGGLKKAKENIYPHITPIQEAIKNAY